MLRVINNVGLSLATNIALYVLFRVCNKDSGNATVAQINKEKVFILIFYVIYINLYVGKYKTIIDEVC